MLSRFRSRIEVVQMTLNRDSTQCQRASSAIPTSQSHEVVGKSLDLGILPPGYTACERRPSMRPKDADIGETAESPGFRQVQGCLTFSSHGCHSFADRTENRENLS